MKARVKATGEIVEVRLCGEWTNMHGDILPYKTNDGVEYSSHDLSFKIDDERGEPQDYWTRLEHQYAGMAMQGLLTNTAMAKLIHDDKTSVKSKTWIFAEWAKMYAHALVEKYKEEERK